MTRSQPITTTVITTIPMASSFIAIKDKDGKLLESRTDIKNRWKEYFEKLYETNPVDKTILQEMPPCNRQEHMEDILREEVEAAVRSLKKRKSPGEDNITAEMIQAGEESSVEMMYVANAVRAPSARVSASAPPYPCVWSRLSHCLYHLTHALFP